MADFVAVLKKTLNGLGQTTPAMRERVYAKARSTIAAKLAAMNPPPPGVVADRQMVALEDAIAKVEAEYAQPAAIDDPLAELENVFASLKNPQPRVLSPQPVAKTETWPKTTPVPAALQPSYDPKPSPAEMPTDGPDRVEMAQDEPDDFQMQRVEERRGRRRSYGGLIAAALGLAVIAGGGYGIWLNKDAFGELFGMAGSETAATVPPQPAAPAETVPPEPAAPAEPEPEPAPDVAAAPEATPPTPAAPAPEEGGKFTQRLTPEGQETDPGPAGGESGLGEGTSVAAVTQQPEEGQVAPSSEDRAEAVAPADPATGDGAPMDGEVVAPAAPSNPTEAADAAVAVGQKAIFYEERTSAAQGSAEPGTIVWSLIQESPGGDLPPEPAIRAEATIPGKDVQLRMTIKRNADQTLPASHIIEMIFLTPEGFEGGGIENILRVAMKNSEQEAGSALIGIPAKIADGFFLVALNDNKAEIDANMALLRRQSWIDVPIVYKSGRRALFTMEKGIPGEKVFDEALKAWQAASAG